MARYVTVCSYAVNSNTNAPNRESTVINVRKILTTVVFFIKTPPNLNFLNSIKQHKLPFTTILMAIGNLFGTGGSTLFSRLLGLLAAEAISFVTGLALYQIEKVRTIRK